MSRQYRLRPGPAFPPMEVPLDAAAFLPGHGVIASPHDDGVFSLAVIRMRALPATPAEVEPRAREIHATGRCPTARPATSWWTS